MLYNVYCTIYLALRPNPFRYNSVIKCITVYNSVIKSTIVRLRLFT
jgi:hypothetical protein